MSRSQADARWSGPLFSIGAHADLCDLTLRFSIDVFNRERSQSPPVKVTPGVHRFDCWLEKFLSD